MVSTRKSPAIFAGLVGMATFCVPMPAQALSLPLGVQVDVPTVNIPFNFQDFIGSPVAYFVLGCVAGAALSGSIVMAVEKGRQDRLAEHFQEGADAKRDSQQPQGQSGQEQPAEAPQGQAQVAYGAERPKDSAMPTDSPLGITGRFAAVASPASQTGVQQSAAGQLSQEANYATSGANRIAEEPARGVDFSQWGSETPSQRFASARKLDAMLPRFDDFGSGATGAASPSAGAVSTHGGPQGDRTGFAAASATNAGAWAGATGSGNSASAAPSATASSASPSRGSSTRATGSTYAERQRNRKRGVRTLLAERLGGNMMDDMPVITRADGTVADIGTGWWDRTMGNTITRLSDVDDSMQLGMRPVDETTDLEATAAFARVLRHESDARPLAQRLPNIDQPLYPETSSWNASSKPVAQSPFAVNPGQTSGLPSSAATSYAAASNQAAPGGSPVTSGASEPEEDMFEQAMRAMEDEMPNRGVTTAADAAVTGVVPAEALGNFQQATVKPTPEAELAHVDNLVKEELERNHEDLPRRRRGKFRVVRGGGDASASEAIASADDTARLARRAYKPKHMKVTKDTDPSDSDSQEFGA